MTQELIDQAIFYRIFSILAEMGLSYSISPYFDFDLQHCCKNYNSHRLYEVSALIRDDLDLDDFVADFRHFLGKYNKISSVKIDFCHLTEYPATMKNYSTIYLTVATI